MKRTVYVLDSDLAPHADGAGIEAEALEGCAQVVFQRVKNGAIPNDADGLILWHQVDLTAADFACMTRTKVVVRNGVGFDTVDIHAAAARGIAVCNVPDYGTEEVADHALALTLALNRQLPLLMKDIERGNWRYESGAACRRSRSLVFGIVGCGRIGTAAALRAKAFGFQVCFFDPYAPAGLEKAIGVTRKATLQELLESADVLSLHAPLTPETHHLIGERELQTMKPTAYIVNTARGALIRFDALRRALAEKWIAGAGLDVLEHEPAGAELAGEFTNCIVTPHSAFYSQEAMREMRRSSALIVRDALLHGRFANLVNRPLSLASA